MRSDNCNYCKHQYADWCHNPNSKSQEKCEFYFNNEDCPDYEEGSSKSIVKTQRDNMIIEDLIKHNSNVTNGLRSVSEDKVYYGHPLGISKAMLMLSQETVCCKLHGAMNAFDKWDKGILYRCIACNEGAVLIINNTNNINGNINGKKVN